MSPPSERDQAQLEASRAPLMAHLGELRTRLWRALLGVLGASVVAFLFHEELYLLITEPLFQVLRQHNLETALKFRTVQGAFMFHFKVAVLAGIFLGAPIALYQLWRFISPGLLTREKLLAIPFVVSSTLCFVGGGAFAFRYVLPEGYDFLIGYAIKTQGHQLLPDINVEDYLGFTTQLLLGFGLIFELPVITAFLALLGLITHRLLIRIWRFAVVGIFIVAAVLTPPDYMSQILMAIPLLALYGLSIGVAWMVTVRRERAAKAALKEPDET